LLVLTSLIIRRFKFPGMLRNDYGLWLLGLLDIEDKDNKIIRNVGKYLPIFTGHHSIKRLESLAAPFTEPKISQLQLIS